MVDPRVWKLYEDVPGKPGWIASPKAAGKITFEMNSSQGWIALEVLKTYENIGSAVCWLDAREPGPGNECHVPGLWPERSSQSVVAFMRTFLPAGRHELSCRS